jgi:hypothetical protein
MSHRVLNSQQFFHGTDREMQPGEPLLPPSATGHESKWPASDPDKVYMSTRPEEAAKYGKHVYQVRPRGKPKKGYYFPEHERTAIHATVLGRHES